MQGSSTELKIAQVYKLCTILGEGAFKKVYQGFDTKKKQNVAIMMETLRQEYKTLEYEAKLY